MSAMTPFWALETIHVFPRSVDRYSPGKSIRPEQMGGPEPA
jgi:hypothetical protein